MSRPFCFLDVCQLPVRVEPPSGCFVFTNETQRFLWIRLIRLNINQHRKGHDVLYDDPTHAGQRITGKGCAGSVRWQA